MVTIEPTAPDTGLTRVILDVSLNWVVAMFWSSVAVIVLVQTGWVGTINIVEKVPFIDESVVVIVLYVPKSMQTKP